MKSEAARLLAVRRVTQDNQGKKTAGVDGVKSVQPAQRLLMARTDSPKPMETTQDQTGQESLDTEAREGRPSSSRDTCAA